MALEGWDWFIKLAENENFTKAADELQISQQTLSARLVSLERNLGAKLVVRGTPISLTSAGKVFLLYAREQRQAQQDMIRQIGEVAGGGAGVLKVGISHTRGSYLMPKVIHRLSEELPAVTVKLIEDTNRNFCAAPSAVRWMLPLLVSRAHALAWRLNLYIRKKSSWRFEPMCFRELWALALNRLSIF